MAASPISRQRWVLLGAFGVVGFLGGGLAGYLTDGDGVVTSAADPGAPATATAAATSVPASVLGTTLLPPTTTRPPIDLAAPPRTQVGSGNPVTLVFGGDVHFDGSLATTLANDPQSVFAGLQPVIADADVAMVNLETSIGDGGDRASKTYNFQASPAAFTALTDAGIDVIGMANNHALDYGQSGLLQTLDAASRVQAPIIGLGGNEMAALAPYRTTVDGQRIAIIAATSVIDGNLIGDWTATEDHPGVASAKRVEQLLAAVTAARADSDTVVVFLHWGTEKAFCADSRQLDLAPQLVAAGADIVVGSHAHRVLAGGYLGDAYVDYGLGNLVFTTSSSDARDTGLLRITVTGRRVEGAEWLPGRIGAKFVPSLLTGADHDAELATWNSRRACSKLADAPANP